MYLLNLKWQVWFIPDPHPPMTIPAVPVLLLLTIHEVAQTNKVRQTGVIPAVEWWVCLQFMLEVTSCIFHSPLLIIRCQMLPQILDPV